MAMANKKEVLSDVVEELWKMLEKEKFLREKLHKERKTSESDKDGVELDVAVAEALRKTLEQENTLLRRKLRDNRKTMRHELVQFGSTAQNLQTYNKEPEIPETSKSEKKEVQHSSVVFADVAYPVCMSRSENDNDTSNLNLEPVAHVKPETSKNKRKKRVQRSSNSNNAASLNLGPVHFNNNKELARPPMSRTLFKQIERQKYAKRQQMMADLERLAEVKTRREEAKKQREAEQKAKISYKS